MASDSIIGAGLCQSPYEREKARAEGLTLMLHAELHTVARLRALLGRWSQRAEATGMMPGPLWNDTREELGDE